MANLSRTYYFRYAPNTRPRAGVRFLLTPIKKLAHALAFCFSRMRKVVEVIPALLMGVGLMGASFFYLVVVLVFTFIGAVLKPGAPASPEHLASMTTYKYYP